MNSINNFKSTTDEVRPHTIPLGELARILDMAEARCEPLLKRLRTPRRVGDTVVYPVEVLWRAVLSKYLLGIRYDAELVARLRTDPGLREVCGFVRVNGDGSILTPTRQVFTRFYKHLVSHQNAVDAAARDLVRELSAVINRGRTLSDHPAGEILAIDSAAIATPRGNYRVHMICDARWGFPVAHCVRQASVTDCSVLPTLVDRVPLPAIPNWLPGTCWPMPPTTSASTTHTWMRRGFSPSSSREGGGRAPSPSGPTPTEDCCSATCTRIGPGRRGCW